MQERGAARAVTLITDWLSQQRHFAFADSAGPSIAATDRLNRSSRRHVPSLPIKCDNHCYGTSSMV